MPGAAALFLAILLYCVEELAERDASGVLLKDYVYGDGIDEVLIATSNQRQATDFYFYDGLGSVTDITDTQGNVIENHAYDAYGTPLNQSTIGNRYMFTGREYDGETGLYHYRSRAYSPTIGRFLQRDPLGYYDSMNLFSYVNNNPVNWIDPWGEAIFSNGQTTNPFNDRWGGGGLGKGGGSTSMCRNSPSIFWSGQGQQTRAEAFAKGNSGKTLEMTFRGRLQSFIDKITGVFNKTAWEKLSIDFANKAKGIVHVFHGDKIRMESFWKKEYFELKKNPNVTDIIFHGGEE